MSTDNIKHIMKTKMPTDFSMGIFENYVRRRPTLPHRNQCSTIGSEGLNFRVRNGTGCFPFDKDAETLLSYVLKLFALQ